jgi:diphthine-ammonia ligase|tara:strand:+ start:133 stop:915 length:783 start_codon:yes stop_codon:yes gene_type:complete
MRVIVLSSGGKDSCYAVWWALMKGWKVSGIVTINITGDDSMMFQVPATSIAGLQASSGGIPWLQVNVEGDEDTEIEELESKLRPIINGTNSPVTPQNWTSDEIKDICDFNVNPSQTIRKLVPGQTIDAIVTGALRSDYQKTRIEQMAQRLGIKSFCPLWHHNPLNHMRDLVHHGFELIFCSVSCDGLDQDWIGKKLDKNSLDELELLAEQNRFSIDGEGGEFETTVLNSPWMNRRISINGDTVWSGRRGHLSISDVTFDE